MYDVPSLICCMPCFIYLCHVSYIYAMFYIFMPWFIYLCHDLHIFMPCFIYLCHVLYIYAMFYIFMSCFIYLCHVLYIYVNFNTCCITIHLCCTKISIFVVLSSLIYVVSTQIYVASTQQIYVVSRFVSSSTFSITPYSEKLSSPAVACGPTYPTGFEITRYNNSQ